MTLFEAGVSTGEVSVGALLAGQKPAAAPGRLTLEQLIDQVMRGGWPATLGLDGALAYETPRQYLASVAESDISRIDGSQRDPDKVKALLMALARNNATTVSNATLAADAATGFGETVSPVTLSTYLHLLKRLFILREIPAWGPGLRSKARIRSAPKRLLADPSLAAAALGSTPALLREDTKTLGFLFEGLALRDLTVYADTLGGSLHHYRDSGGLEVDAVLTAPSGAWAAFEIKTTALAVDKAERSLARFAKRMAAVGQPAPACLAVVVGTGEVARATEDGIVIAPIDLLGP
jgi:predicted AAA+ superfamily ATPase